MTGQASEQSIFLHAIGLASPADRAAYLDEICRDNPGLRAELDALIAAHDRLGSDPGQKPADNTRSSHGVEHIGVVLSGRYKLLEVIGEGGMGTVYMAQQTEPVKRLVALKLIKPGMDSRQVIARFEAERQALALMDHPNIARVLDAGTSNGESGGVSPGTPFFVMELVKGVPLTKYCDEHRLTPRQRLELFIPVCQAIQHAHQKGIIHRDIKPSNVLVAQYDAKPVPKVIDFGVAKATGQQLTDHTLVTGFGAVVGTLEYMSPEQAELNQLDIDTRSDIYALGVLLYELLTGTTPLEKKQLRRVAFDEMLRIIREQEPPRPSTRLSESKDSLPSVAAQRQTEPAKLTKLVRGELDWIVMKALEKDRNRRYETANGFAMDVQRYLADEPVQACPPSAGYRLRKFIQRNKGGLAVAALVLFFLVLLGSGAGWAVRDRSARDAEAARQQEERRTKVAGQVESIFGEVDRLEKEQKWTEALAAARRAEAAVAGGEADPATAERVRTRLKDLEFIDRLERIRMQRATWVEGKFDSAEANREYAQAFRDYGVDVGVLPVETTIDRFKSRPALATPLTAALDDWVYVRREDSQEDAAGWKRLVAVARGIDPDSLRDRLRAAWGQPVANVRDDLRRLADSIDIRAHLPATVVILAYALRRVDEWDSGLRLLRDAQFIYPEDFWLNFELGVGLSDRLDYEGAIRFYTAAMAIRPNSTAAINNLGLCLHDQKKLDVAIAFFRKAIEIDPKHTIANLNLGRTLGEQNKWDEASASLRKAIDRDPKNAPLLFGLGRVLASQKKLDEAVACYKKGIEIDPKFAPSHYNLGLVLADQNKLDEANACFHKAIELNPKYAGGYIGVGNILRHQKKLDEAIACYHKAIELDPEIADAHGMLGILLCDELRDYEKAAEAFRKAIELDPKRARTHSDLGNALRGQKKLDEAIAAYRRAIELDPKLAHAHRCLSVALRQKGRIDESIAECQKAVELDPKHADVYAELGILLCNELKDYRKAEEAFRKTIELDPKNAKAYRNLGNVLRAQKKLDEAIAACLRVIELHPKQAYGYIDLGIILCDEMRDYDKAVEAFRTAIELDPQSAVAHCNLGNALCGQKKIDEGITAYRKAIELDPKLASAYHSLGNALIGQKKLPEAIEALSKAIELDPKSASGHNNLGALYCDGLREYGKAVECFRKAVELDPKNAHRHSNLGNALRGAGQLDEAIAEYRKAIELAPTDAVTHFKVGNALKAKGDLDGAERAYREAVRLDGNRHGAAIDALAGLLLSRGQWKEALATANKAVELAPESDMAWQVLGWAHYRNADWKASIAALEKSCALQDNPKGGDAGQWFILAMAHWRLGEKDKAREWYDRAVQWMDKNMPGDELFRRFRAEAAELLELKEKK